MGLMPLIPAGAGRLALTPEDSGGAALNSTDAGCGPAGHPRPPLSSALRAASVPAPKAVSRAAPLPPRSARPRPAQGGGGREREGRATTSPKWKCGPCEGHTVPFLVGTPASPGQPLGERGRRVLRGEGAEGMGLPQRGTAPPPLCAPGASQPGPSDDAPQEGDAPFTRHPRVTCLRGAHLQTAARVLHVAWPPRN